MIITMGLILAWVALATYADTLFKGAASLSSKGFVAGVLCYATCGVFALFTFQRQQWGWIILTWNCCSLALSMILSVTAFSEPFTIRRAIASVLVMLAMLLTE